MIDLIYKYKGFHRFKSKCRIRIYKTSNNDIVIATELKDNPGTPITNYAEQLATRIKYDYDIDPERLIWIEHYPARVYSGDKIEKESYDIVKFEWDGEKYSKPEWKHSSKEEVETLIGMQLKEESDVMLQ